MTVALQQADALAQLLDLAVSVRPLLAELPELVLQASANPLAYNTADITKAMTEEFEKRELTK